jgi:hypothetical protein
MENGDESHDEANYASKPGHLWSHKIRKFSMPMPYAVLNWASSQVAISNKFFIQNPLSWRVGIGGKFLKFSQEICCNRAT